jgi:hypothetical protein
LIERAFRDWEALAFEKGARYLAGPLRGPPLAVRIDEFFEVHFPLPDQHNRDCLFDKPEDDPRTDY